MMLQSCLYAWISSICRPAVEHLHSGERDSGVKWEKKSVRPSTSTLLDLLTQAWFVAQLNTSRTNGNY
jgi:hypothetical protein